MVMSASGRVQKGIAFHIVRYPFQHRAVLGHLAPVFCVAFDVSGQRIISVSISLSLSLSLIYLLAYCMIILVVLYTMQL